ncbi:Uu.00g110170.m01.CDS01 [Anthostomella pinea]|uniref:Uu.00g110170.m01.CDS01 n=1 Tax=Anthostomella pinea TaxID=933095 RepID=A0AAI8VFW3_9PEZI|nr:Uu.00g110170.m01.CDS01 [Anthostomella pinea]
MSTPIPQPPGVPLLGNIFDIDPNNTWASLKKLSEKYGEIFQIKVLGQTLVFVAGAALAEELSDEKRFRKFVGGPIVEIRYAVHDALFTAYEREASWGIAHRIIAPELTPRSVSERFSEMRDATNELIAKWKTLGTNNTISAIGELNKLNLEATTLTLYGKKLNCLDAPEHPMIKGMEDSTSEAMKRPTRPALLNWLWYGGKFKAATKTMRAYASELVQHRKANPTERRDVLAALMSAQDPETGTALTDSQVIDEIVSMPIGSSTAPALLATSIHFLLKNPHVIVKAREELDAVVGSEELTYAHLADLKYVEGIVRESLRLSFAAPGFNIEPIPKDDDKSPVLLGGGRYQIAHNQAVIVVLAGVNRDPTVFEEPLAFKPERMMGGAFDGLPAGVKKWFGNGKRECIGKHWAWQFNMTVLAKLITEVDFEMADPGYELEQDGWFNLRPVDFYVKVKPRAS